MKTSSISVKIGTYTGRDGQTKNRYKKLGELIEKDDGGKFITLDATLIGMPLFALANKERNDKIVCSVFDNDRDKQPSGGTPDTKQSPMAGIEDDIPF